MTFSQLSAPSGDLCDHDCARDGAYRVRETERARDMQAKTRLGGAFRSSVQETDLQLPVSLSTWFHESISTILSTEKRVDHTNVQTPLSTCY